MRINKRILFLIAFGFLFLLILSIWLFTGKTKDTTSQDPYAWEKTEIETQTIELPFTMDETRAMTKELWGKASLDPYEILLSDDDRLWEFYNIHPTERPSYITIIPNNIEYEFNVEKVTLNHKEITITYSHGNPITPRMVGHQQIFPVNVFYIETQSIEDDVYTIKMINEEKDVTLIKKLDFKGYHPVFSWEVKGLNWAKENELIFSSNREGSWQIWLLDLNEEEPTPLQLTSRHKDLDLHDISSLGSKNINYAYPYYMPHKDKIIYHAEYDIYEVDRTGKRNDVLTYAIETYPQPESHRKFAHEPKPSNDGRKVAYRVIYSPMKSELYLMNTLGEYRHPISIPQQGYIELFEWSPESDQIAVVISNRESELRGGRSNMWVLYPKTEEEPRKITTGGYNINSIDFGPDNKSIVFSMKMNQATAPYDTDIWKVNSNNTELTRLTPKDKQIDIKPVFSPDGSKIAFLSSTDNENFYLWIMDANGEGRRQLDKTVSIADSLLWSSDGEEIFFADGKGAIYKYNLLEEKLDKVLDGGV
mgnify:CR=1 FL=1